MRQLLRLPPFVFLLCAVLVTPASAEPRKSSRDSLERTLMRTPSTRQLRDHHDRLASRTHVAGSPGDRAVIDSIASHFRDLGLETEVQEIWVYLPAPVSGSLQLTSPVHKSLSISEAPLAEDPYTQQQDLPIGWNAYSGSGSAEGEVIYANYGRKEDFETLADLGIDLKGKIVVARYGGNFRGYKAKFAEAAGAAGLVIYTDPGDSGYAKGLMYPEGGYANSSHIQRGSILTLPWRGDPLTPHVPATRDAERLDPESIPLPRIPVQPVGWEAAAEILSRMQGEAVPHGWQGGLPFPYRLQGGADLRIRVEVEQKRELVKTANVTGLLRGRLFPERKVVFGAHHDSWGFGAGDPTSGTILVLESARSFAEAAKKGLRPARSIVFAAWAAEEFGILGSVEWVEAHREDLEKNAIAYLNADMATMGSKIHSSADPFLKTAIASAAERVPHPYEKNRTVLDTWKASEAAAPNFGDLGGGSDHIGFYCHLTIPSAAVGTGGARGTSYHSNYDTLTWYRKIVGDDYEPARMLTQVDSLLLRSLADEIVLPLDPVLPAVDFRRHLDGLDRRAKELGQELNTERLRAASRVYEARAREVRAQLEAQAEAGTLSWQDAHWLDPLLIQLTRSWSHPAGLPNRSWYRNLYAASDESSGYRPWMLPALRHAVEHGDRAGFAAAERSYIASLRLMEHWLDLISAGLEKHEGSEDPPPTVDPVP